MTQTRVDAGAAPPAPSQARAGAQALIEEGSRAKSLRDERSRAKSLQEERSRATSLQEERSRALARRGRATSVDAATRSYLVCACGADRFGLPLGQVAQVLPMRPVTPLPDAGPALLGLLALSGRVVSLLALAQALGRPAGPVGAGGHVVVVRGGAAPVALAVDRVLGVAEIPESMLNTADAEAGLSAEAVSGYCPPGAGPGAEAGFVAIDLPRLLRRYLS